ncbi:hypothetical protein [Thalassococcus lentus]|uniref:Peptidase M23 n=1 Tax=Thalassococcus lentus TaxID=1210524 RepID=A0ABT4XPI1_9RHOB|nr:hypothetical protein [Thalassococcus lentus]MDA7423840.1 hypothetical protein [Thalassococcus lentus]
MKIKALALLASFAASPAVAHPGAHMHPHSVEGWVVGLGILAMLGAGVVALRARK